MTGLMERGNLSVNFINVTTQNMLQKLGSFCVNKMYFVRNCGGNAFMHKY